MFEAANTLSFVAAAKEVTGSLVAAESPSIQVALPTVLYRKVTSPQ
jgi:hypothetical protein